MLCFFVHINISVSLVHDCSVRLFSVTYTFYCYMYMYMLKVCNIMIDRCFKESVNFSCSYQSVSFCYFDFGAIKYFTCLFYTFEFKLVQL